ncbi:MAG: DNA recombination protein RmuC [Candidatus Margulisiibacteriota bacterium]
MLYLLSFVAGTLFGAAVVFVLNRAQMGQAKDSFKAISSDVLSKHAEDFLVMAKQALAAQTQTGENALENKKMLIDQTLSHMKEDLVKVGDLMKTLEKDRENKFGEVSTQLKFTAEQTSKLQDTTNKLQSVLASTKARGQWGERMAEDVLRLAGFVEGINFKKQKALESGSKPDFTFFLPNKQIVNMDVKFPLNGYLQYVASENEIEKKSYKDQFLRDVKGRIKEVTTRDYINPESNTVDYVIVFVPNEQVYAFINESDASILDEALKNKVIFCSPLTLYAILAVIRQAMDNFKIEKTASEMSGLLGSFYQQWKEFTKSMDKLGRSIESTQNEYQTLVTTRRNKLERPLKMIEDLRVSKGIALAVEDNGTKELAE